jgi:ribosomal protein S18 acetylase RimI-like enzyme
VLTGERSRRGCRTLIGTSRAVAGHRASAALEEEPAAANTHTDGGGGDGGGEGGNKGAVAAADAPEAAAAWILEYDNGSIGMLYTRKSHRRRGYGRVVARALAVELAAAHARGARAAPPFCFVAEDNVASLRIFEGLGFARRGEVAWLRFMPAA